VDVAIFPQRAVAVLMPHATTTTAVLDYAAAGNVAPMVAVVHVVLAIIAV
jgi:hypothetical protein